MTLARHSDFANTDLVNEFGDRVRLLNYGARVQSIVLATTTGPREVVLGHASPESYIGDPFYLGATIGRYCNRIRNARFGINGHEYRLAANEGMHHLHGGDVGFDKRYWRLETDAARSRARFTLESEHGDQGYPGRLTVSVEYAWGAERGLVIRYSAETDRPTHVNLTNHTYFNLDADRGTAFDHSVRVNSRRITALAADGLPTGAIVDVGQSPLDLRSSQQVAALQRIEHAGMRFDNGIDINFALEGDALAAELRNSAGDLTVTVETTCPGLQLYCGQNLRPPFSRGAGICLEAQYFPDSPNQPAFPNTLITPDRPYLETTCYRFAEIPAASQRP